LGLATVFGIVAQHHGWIEVESKLNSGTTFDIFLPRLAESEKFRPNLPAPLKSAAEMKHFAGRRRGVVRSLARTVLEHKGYHIIEADSAGAPWSSGNNTATRLIFCSPT